MNRNATTGPRLLVVFGRLLAAGAVILAALCLFVRWGKPTTSAEICGIYVADHELAREELTLRPDGTFAQVVTVKATLASSFSEGKWAYDAGAGDVTFYEGFMIVLEGPHELNPDYDSPGLFIVDKSVRYWFGFLVIGDEFGDWPVWRKVK